METENEKRIQQTKDICVKVFEALIGAAGEEDYLDMDVSLNGVAMALASLFLQYNEQADDDITIESMIEDFKNRIGLALKATKLVGA